MDGAPNRGSGDIDGSSDMLSTLPEPILHHILCFLDQKSAAKTCVLSMSWRYLWCTRPELFFSMRECFKGNTEASLSVLDRALQIYHDRKLCLQKLILIMSVDDETDSLLNKWIPILIQNMRIKRFRLGFVGPQIKEFHLPSSFFEWESLEELVMLKCTLQQSSADFKAVRMFKHLRKLLLCNVYISEQVLDSVLSNCSSIEYVSLSYCAGFARIRLKQHHPTNLKNFCFNGDREDAVSIETWDDIPTLGTLRINRCLFSVHSYQLLHFSHLSRLMITNVKMSSEVFSCSLPCLEEFVLDCCQGIKEFNLSSRSILRRLDINNPNRPFKVTVDAPSIVSFLYEGILPQSISLPAAATTSIEYWKSKIDLTFPCEPSHCFNELNGLLYALSQSEITLEIDQIEISRFRNQLHIEQDDGSCTNNIVGVSEAKLPVVVEHLTIQRSGDNLHSSSADLLNSLFHMFRPSFIYLDLLNISMNEHHQAAEFLFKERETVQSYFWERVLEGVSLQVLYRNQSEWQPVEYTSFTELSKIGEVGELRLHLKWIESSL